MFINQQSNSGAEAEPVLVAHNHPQPARTENRWVKEIIFIEDAPIQMRMFCVGEDGSDEKDHASENKNHASDDKESYFYDKESYF